MRRNINWIGRGLAALCGLLTLAAVETVTAQEFVANGAFEEDVDLWTAWPGYVNGTDAANPGLMNPPEITEWFHGGGVGINPIQPRPNENPSGIVGFIGSGGNWGINPVTDPNAADPAPFRDNGDNDTTVAFMQGTASLLKEVTGLTVGQNYIFSLDYNARNCCGDFPVPELRLNGTLVPDFPDPQFSPDGVVLPVGDFNPWYFSEIPFTAASTNLSILISTQSELGLDSTFLVDNLELASSAGGGNLIDNGDFEADADTFPVWPGYVGNEAQRAPFRDNGNNVSHIAFMQGDARLEQDLSGLTVGEDYTLSFDFNSRNCCGDIPIAELLLDGQPLDAFPGDDLVNGITPVGGQNDWYHFETTITAERSTLTLTFHSFPAEGRDATFLLDNVSFHPAAATVPGDFNGDGILDATDVNDLTGQSASGLNNLTYDLNSDNLVDEGDVRVWVKDLFGSWIGDANLDKQFNSSDLVDVLASGKYEANDASVWTEGDFNGDGRTNSGDLIVALADGGYEQGPPPAQAVPEPSTAVLAGLALALGLLVIRRRVVG